MKSAARNRERVENEEVEESGTDAFAQSIRFDERHGAFLKKRQQETKSSVAEIVRGFVDDSRTFYDTPSPQLEKHLADMAALGLTQREYIRYLLSLRYEAMILGHVSLSEPPSRSRS